MSKIGIYRIKNTLDDKIYIGSSNNIARRWRHHKDLLNRGIHHSIHLQNAWKKYGETTFLFDVLEILDDESLILTTEQKYLDLFESYNQEKGYNISKYAGSPFKGNKHTEETRKIQSLKNSGVNHWAYGKHLNEEHKEKISCIKRKISKEQEKNVLEDYKRLETAYEVAKIYNVHAETIYRILRRHGIANPRQK